jgi:hypothetical protein
MNTQNDQSPPLPLLRVWQKCLADILGRPLTRVERRQSVKEAKDLDRPIRESIEAEVPKKREG